MFDITRLYICFFQFYKIQTDNGLR